MRFRSPIFGAEWRVDAISGRGVFIRANGNRWANHRDDDDSLAQPLRRRQHRPRRLGLIGPLVREEGHIPSLAASGNLLYSGSEDKTFKVWRIADSRCLESVVDAVNSVVATSGG